MEPSSSQSSGPLAADEARSLDHPAKWQSSWVDRAQALIGSWRLPWWLLLLAVPLLLVLLEISLLVSESGTAALTWPTPLGLTLIYAGFPFYVFGWLYLIDGRATSAVDQIRPLLREDGSIAQLRFSISNMPSRPTVLASLAGLAFFFVLRSVADVTGNIVLSGTTGSTRWVRLFEGVILWTLMGVSTYHTVRQLGIINRIYTRHVRVNLLNQAPLYELARIPVYTAMSIVLPVSLILLVLPRFPYDPVSESLLLSTILFTSAIVIAPIYRVHLELEDEKVKRQSLNAKMIEMLLRRFRNDATSSSSEELTRIQTSFEILNKEREIMKSAPTWPWPPGSMKTVTAALLLPTIIWIIQQLLRSTLGMP